MWVKLGILLTGFIYAGVLPYAIRKALNHIDFDTGSQTLSFFSNKSLYDRRYRKAYKRLLFLMAILTYLFFGLLSWLYDLGQYERFMRHIDYSFAFITLLAFVPHNIEPWSIRTFGLSVQRLLHNVLAVVVFLTLPGLIILFQISILPDNRFPGITGLVIIGLVLLTVLISVIRNGINGASEILFINGISIWCLFVTVVTFIR